MEPLYAIADDILKLQDILEDAEGDEGLQEALEEALSDSELDLKEKAANIVRLLRNWEGQMDMIKAEEKRLYERRKSIEARSDQLRGYLLWHLQRIDVKKIDSDVATISRRMGAERVEIDDDLDLPQGYFEAVSMIKPDKTALKKLWKATPEEERDQLTGFHVERGNETLTIR